MKSQVHALLAGIVLLGGIHLAGEQKAVISHLTLQERCNLLWFGRGTAVTRCPFGA